MRGGIVVAVAVIALAAAAAILVYAVDLEVRHAGRPPAVDVTVDVDPGALPEGDLDMADVELSMKERSVTLPTVELVPAGADAGDNRGG